MYRLVILLLILAMALSAGDFVELGSAKSAAMAHIASCPDFKQGPFGHKLGPSLNILDNETSEILGYVFALLPNGFIITSANTEIRPIIAYSAENPYDMEDSPSNVPHQVFKHDLKMRSLALSQTRESVRQRNNELWEDYLACSPRIFCIYPMSLSLGPYLDTQWNQGSPYNMFCPIDPVTLARCPIGCVVTAMGQIINYWEWPPSVYFDDTDDYMSTRTSPPIYVEAASATLDTIDWNAVGHHPDDTTMARFLFGCGVSIFMQYADGGSSAWSGEMVNALTYKWNYYTVMGIWPSSGSFYSEIALDVLEGRVSHLSLSDGGDGHAIVVDGYRESGEYHVNYGWGGTADGWYFIPDSLPYDFTTATYGIVGIMPPVITHRPVVGLEATQLNGGYIRLNWNLPTLITEPVLRYNIYRRLPAGTDELLASTTTRQFIDTTFDELTRYVYSVGAVYDVCGESRRMDVEKYSGIRNGWTRVIGESGNAMAFAIAPHDTGGFVAVGRTVPLFSGGSNLTFIKMDLDGTILQQRTYGGASSDGAKAVQRLSDEGYIIAGWTESFGAGGSDIWLLRTDSDGDTIWTKTIGTAEPDSGISITLSTSGGFVILGATGTESILLVETDSDGNVIRERTYGPNLVGKSITALESGGYAICGFSPAGSLGNKDIFVMKLDSSLDSLWLRHYGGASLDEGSDIIENSSGELIVVGKSRSFGMPLYTSTFAMKTTSDGDMIVSKSTGGSHNYSLNRIAKHGSNYVAVGVADLSSPGILIHYLDSNLDTIRTHIYSTVGNEEGTDILPLDDGGIAIAGVTTLYGNQDRWLLKVGGRIYYGIEESNSETPQKISLRTYPNPFNSAVTIETPFGAVLQLFDLRGRLVAEPREYSVESNKQLYSWRPSSETPSGVYFARINLDGEVSVSRLVYLK